MLNSADNNSFSDLVSVYLKVLDHLTWNFQYFRGIQQVLNSDFLKFRILEKGYFHLCPRMNFLQTLHINNSLYTNYENVFIELDS